MEDKELKFYVSDISRKAYMETLISNIWKILPIFEGYGKDNVVVYINGLLIDLCSADNLFDGYLSEIIVKLNSIIVVDMTHKELKKKVLECIDIVKRKKSNEEL